MRAALFPNFCSEFVPTYTESVEIYTLKTTSLKNDPIIVIFDPMHRTHQGQI